MFRKANFSLLFWYRLFRVLISQEKHQRLFHTSESFRLAATIPFTSPKPILTKKTCVSNPPYLHQKWQLDNKEAVGPATDSSPAYSFAEIGLQTMMESFLDLDQLLSGKKLVTPPLPTELTSLVNDKDCNVTDSVDETFTHSVSEVKFEDAWDIITAMETDPNASFESLFNSISTMQKFDENENDNLITVNTSGLDTPGILANVPLDISTPDLDTAILTSDIPELFSSSMVEKINLSAAPSSDVIVDKHQIQDKVLTEGCNDQLLINTAPSQPILTLNIGENSSNLLMGNGAQLQLKRKASSSNNQTVEIKSVESNTDNVMTIVIKLENNSTDNKQDQESDDFPPTKKIRYDQEDKYSEMRRKNNEASRRCRKNRKLKQQDMSVQAEQLQKDNEELRRTVTDLENQIQRMKSQIIAMFQNKSSK